MQTFVKNAPYSKCAPMCRPVIHCLVIDHWQSPAHESGTLSRLRCEL